ncbi:MAG: hypothetical protein IPF53_21730 [Blastocatellia bacterium]|nr:hypothetical protein [Blastocatellia bacterium]MBK6424795.1 hypothetical protein [Blastocatellia bacterium]
MEIAGFNFVIGQLDGCRLIESVFPAVFDQHRLWAVAASYPLLWEEQIPTVTINDVSGMGELDGEAPKVLAWILQQNQLRAQIVATSWVIGANVRAGEQIRDVLLEVGRPTDTIFATVDEAKVYLRDRIRVKRDGLAS